MKQYIPPLLFCISIYTEAAAGGELQTRLLRSQYGKHQGILIHVFRQSGKVTSERKTFVLH